MIEHYIIMASAYSIGKRIVLDFCDKDILQMDVIQKDIDYIIKACGEDTSISTHSLQTTSTSFESIKDKDKFFEDILLVKTKEEFVDLVLADRDLKGIDVAKYILSVIPCTHLKLEKLAYMCYADYLCETKQQLFSDRIYAYKLGPIIDTIYKKYKKSGYQKLEEDDKKTYSEDLKKLPIRSRIIASKSGLKKLSSIDKTIEKYGKYSASELVNLTHGKLTPWTVSGSGIKAYTVITDDLIKNYHINECKQKMIF